MVLVRAREAGITSIICVAENVGDASRVLELSDAFPMLRPAVGLFPGVLELRQVDEISRLIRRHRDRLAGIDENYRRLYGL